MSKERHDEDFLDAIRAADGSPLTPEIADALGCADRTALVRLHELADAGEVKRRKVPSWSDRSNAPLFDRVPIPPGASESSFGSWSVHGHAIGFLEGGNIWDIALTNAEQRLSRTRGVPSQS